MVIAQISDTHILARASGDPLGGSRAEDLRLCVTDINRQAVDAVIHTGDSVQHGTADEYAHLREILAELKAPLFLTPGNRDQQAAMRTAFQDFSYLPSDGDLLHYVSSSQAMMDEENRPLPGFTRERAAARRTRLCVRPPKPNRARPAEPPSNTIRQQDAENLAALVSRHPQVERLLCGHVHCWHREPWGGTVATTMPSVAVDLRKGVDAALGMAPLYLLHIISSDGGMVSQTRVVPH